MGISVYSVSVMGRNEDKYGVKEMNLNLTETQVGLGGFEGRNRPILFWSSDRSLSRMILPSLTLSLQMCSQEPHEQAQFEDAQVS